MCPHHSSSHYSCLINQSAGMDFEARFDCHRWNAIESRASKKNVDAFQVKQKVQRFRCGNIAPWRIAPPPPSTHSLPPWIYFKVASKQIYHKTVSSLPICRAPSTFITPPRTSNHTPMMVASHHSVPHQFIYPFCPIAITVVSITLCNAFTCAYRRHESSSPQVCVFDLLTLAIASDSSSPLPSSCWWA